MGLFLKRRPKSRLTSTNLLVRLIGPGVSSIGILFALFMLISGNWSFSALDQLLGSVEQRTDGGLILLGDRDDRPAGCIRIATFNVDQFNEAKSELGESEAGVDVLGAIAQIVKTFDLIAIQELRGSDGVALQRLVALLNESSQPPGAESGGVSGGRYAATMSEPIGEENPESYAFLWDKTRVNLVPGSDYVVLDTGNRIYREPMVASFQTALPADGAVRPFRFTMINVHTQPDRGDPSVLQNEINVLADVFQRVRIYESENFAEDDFILLGALNTNAESLRQLTTIPGVVSLAGSPDVDSPNRTDHIVIDQGVTAEYAGRTGVIDFRTALGLTDQQAQGISHHVPVWAEFSIYERAPVPPKQATATGARTRLIQ